MTTLTFDAQSYGPYVMSDLTNYCHREDLVDLMNQRFPATSEQPEPWKIVVE